MGFKRSQPINILLVEDNPGDAYLIKNTLTESPIPYQLSHVLDGQEAMEFLYQQGKYLEVARPHLILLDLNLPLKSGLEVLQEIKSSPNLQMVPVIILTSSSTEQDILQSYNLYANCYLSKPIDINEFITIIKSLESFWFQFVQFPSN